MKATERKIEKLAALASADRNDNRNERTAALQTLSRLCQQTETDPLAALNKMVAALHRAK